MMSPPLVSAGQSRMQAEIHPFQYKEITFVAFGNVIKTRSTVCEDIHLEVCSNCHPFYTGKQKVASISQHRSY